MISSLARQMRLRTIFILIVLSTIFMGHKTAYSQMFNPDSITVFNVWDDYYFTGNDLKTDNNFGQRFRWFVTVLPEKKPQDAKMAVDIFFKLASANPANYADAAGMFDMVFNYPNSPVRNEKLGIIVLEYLSKSELISMQKRNKYTTDLSNARLNCSGSKANNFSFLNPNNNQMSLYQVVADYTLVYFYNPECEACRQISVHLLSDPLLNSWINENKLTFLAIYTDKDEISWKNYIKGAANWSHGWDKDMQIDKQQLYYLNALPSLYLLDAQKNVLIKDASLDQLFNFFSQN